jgi:hypothetical protein
MTKRASASKSIASTWKKPDAAYVLECEKKARQVVQDDGELDRWEEGEGSAGKGTQDMQLDQARANTYGINKAVLVKEDPEGATNRGQTPEYFTMKEAEEFLGAKHQDLDSFRMTADAREMEDALQKAYCGLPLGQSSW